MLVQMRCYYWCHRAERTERPGQNYDKYKPIFEELLRKEAIVNDNKNNRMKTLLRK